MCGIVGVQFRVPCPLLDSNLATSLGTHLTEALSLMTRRGPDDAGTAVAATGTSGVGMARLRVRSMPEDTVPFCAPDGSAYAFNGEVYEVFRDGRRCAVKGGVDEGRAVLDATLCPDGMWALACLGPNGSITVSRDPWGIKPLWLRTWTGDTEDVEQWMVASSLGAVLSPGPSPCISTDAVAQVLLAGQIIDGGSLWEGVRPIPPGARTVTDHKGLTPEERFAPVLRQVTRSLAAADGDAEVGALIRGAIASSVAATLNADRVTGLALSGGLDSTIIAHHARDLGRDDLRTVSIRVEGDEDGVTSLADLRWEGSAPSGWQHHVRWVGPHDYLDLLRRSVRELGQPTSMTSVPLYLSLADAAAEAGIVVLVVGEGADEVWGGYRSYLNVDDATPPIDFYLSGSHLDLVKELVGAEAAENALAKFLHLLPAGSGGEVIRRIERTLSLGPLLQRTDVLMMARSIEARTPFLHGESWALAAQLPWHSLVTSDQTKVALRAAYGDLLPRFRDERKTAFRAPWDRWLATDLAAEVTLIVRSAAPQLRRFGIDPAVALEVVSRGVAGQAAAAACSFTLCTLALWSEALDDA